MSPTTIRQPLRYSCVAEIQVTEDERAPHVAPELPIGDHNPNCCCVRCRAQRADAAGQPKAT